MSKNQSISTKLYRNKLLQRHILELRKSHTETLAEIKQLKQELKVLHSNKKSRRNHEARCEIAEKIARKEYWIKEQSRMLKMYKQKNANFHRRYHDDIVQRKKYITGTLEQQPIDLKRQIYLQKVIAKNKIQLNPKTSSLTTDDRFVLAIEQHKLKKQLRDHDWSGAV